jgi:flagellar motor switch/type III secretory pathway protein FliN
MTRINPTLDAEVIMSAVISRTAMPAVAIAALQPGDLLETEPEIGNLPIVRLTIGNTTVALATVAKVDGRLIATITENRPESAEQSDTWKLRKTRTSTD